MDIQIYQRLLVTASGCACHGDNDNDDTCTSVIAFEILQGPRLSHTRRLRQARTIASLLSRLQSRLRALRLNLESLRSLEKVFDTCVQQFLYWVFPEYRRLSASLLRPRAMPLYRIDSVVEEIFVETKKWRRHIADYRLEDVRKWAAETLDVVATYQGHLGRRRASINSLLERLHSCEDEYDLVREVEEEARKEERLSLERLDRLYKYYATLLRRVLDAVISFSDGTVLPNRHRLPCRTMPWDILPSLVILWGVCWMFYTPPVTPLPNEALPPIGGSGVDCANLTTDVTQDSSLARDIPMWADKHWDLTGLDFESFFNAVQPMDTCYDIDQARDHLLDMQADDVLPRQASIDLDHIFRQSSNLHPSTSQAILDMVFDDPVTQPTASAATPISNVERLFHSNYDDENERYALLASDQSSLADGTSTTQIMSQSVTMEHSTGMSPSSGLRDNTRPDLRCDRVECENIVFQYKSDWQRHIDKHTRPFQCEVIGCTRVDGFSTKGQLHRHMRMHSHASSSQMVPRSSHLSLYCPNVACDRSASRASNKPFTRKDNRDDHVRRKHGPCGPEEAAHRLSNVVFASAEGHSNDVVQPESQHSTDDVQSLTPVAGKRKRTDADDETAEPSAPATRQCTHQAEIDALKAEVKVLKCKLAVSKEKEEALFAALIQATKTGSKDT